MWTDMIALVQLSNVDTDLVLQRHVTDPCACGNRDCAEDAEPAEAVYVQYGVYYFRQQIVFMCP